jgi:hypothetical protein
MLGTDLVVSSYVVIKHGCPVAMSVDSPDQVQVMCGRGPREAFEFVMEREALRAFVELGTDALRQMDGAEPA